MTLMIRWKTWSKNSTYTPTAKLTTKTSAVSCLVWANVGQETLPSSETASARKRRIRVTRSFSTFQGMAGAIGLEPTTAGFGDQCSAN